MANTLWWLIAGHFFAAQDGTEQKYTFRFDYQDNEAYIEKLVLVQKEGGIPGNGKVLSTETLDGEVPRIVIDNS